MLENVPEGYYIWFVSHPRKRVPPEKSYSQIDAPFSVDASIDLSFVLHDVSFLHDVSLLFIFAVDTWFSWNWISFRITLLVGSLVIFREFQYSSWQISDGVINPIHCILLIMKKGHAQLDWKHILVTHLSENIDSII